jgi:CelD/BcsL family acetyltransferase involved in cellulose biosynthesis
LSKLTVLSPQDQRWRTFAVAHATSPMQHPTWLDALTRAYRLEARITALTNSQGVILAALPLICSKLPWRQSWTALPFTDTLEPVAMNAAHRDDLLIAAAAYGDTQPILIRTHAPLAGWFSRQVGTVQVIDLSDGAEGVLRGADAKTRRNIKRAQRPEVGLTARPIASRSEFLGASLTLMARSRRRLGAPTQPRRYWSHVWELHERDEALTIGVYLGGKLVSNGVFIVGSNHAVYKYSASDSATWKLRANYLMLATAFDHIAARGVQSMDFGITDLHNTSLREYKARWGGEEQPAHFSATDTDLLPDTLEPGRLLSSTIQHMPVLVGRAVGSLAYPFVA